MTLRGEDISLDSKFVQSTNFGLGTGSKNFVLKILYSAVRLRDARQAVVLLRVMDKNCSGKTRAHFCNHDHNSWLSELLPYSELIRLSIGDLEKIVKQ